MRLRATRTPRPIGLKIRDIVLAENYDPEYPGVDEAIAQFELVDEYFYELLQEEHIEIIGTQLARFAESDSYIEKVGICTYLDRYFANNSDINLELEEIQEFIYKLERYKAELEDQKVDYEALLEENTAYFISTVNSMRMVSTYAELKPLYDKALSYYYSMNVGTEEADAAVLLFDEYEKALAAIEINSVLFIETAKTLDIVSILGVSAEFSILSELSGYYEYVDVTFSDELADVMFKYESMVKTYNDAVNSANKAAETASNVSSALRSNQVSVAILAAVNQLYKTAGR